MIRLLVERILREAVERGGRSISMKCWPKDRWFGETRGLVDLAEDLGKDEENSVLRIRDREYVLGISIRGKDRDLPFMSVPVSLFLPILNVLTSEATVIKGRRGFAIYHDASSRKKVERFLDVMLYLESDSSISIDFAEIAS